MLDRSKLTSPHSTGLDTAKEIAKFDRLAKEWRDPKGKFKQVLAFNQNTQVNYLLFAAKPSDISSV